MTRLEWDSSLNTGDERIDAEHRHLFEIFNALADASDEGQENVVRETLEELTAYVATHFEHEERRMRVVDMPEDEVEAHIDEHRGLTQSVRERVLQYRVGDLTIADLVAFLREWLMHHVREIDAVLVGHIRRAQPET